jgi:recombination protein RecT
MTETVSGAVAERDNSPSALIEKYATDFATVLPSHVKPETWVRLAQGALRRNATLEQAARSNPGSLLAALLDAARLGLEPGTEQYYLVPYKDRGRPLVQGIPGYQGEVELMYRAGAVSSVVVESVRRNDTFVWRAGSLDSHRPTRWEGPQQQPFHDVDWFGGERGELIGVYAYAVMTDGAISKVVVLDKAELLRARAKSASYRSKPETSPWTTDEEAMSLKTAAHRLRKWVPTSAEFRRELARAAAEVQRVASAPAAPPGADQPPAEWIDGDVVDDAPADADGWPEVAPAGSDG